MLTKRSTVVDTGTGSWIILGAYVPGSQLYTGLEVKSRNHMHFRRIYM